MRKIVFTFLAILVASYNYAQNVFPEPTGNAEIKSGNLLIETDAWKSSLITFKDTHYSPDQIYHFQIESDGLKIKQDGNVNYNFKSGGDFLVRNGKLGVGTYSPSSKLDVYGGIRASTDASRFIMFHSSSDGNSYINYHGGSSSSRLGFQINGSSKMSIMNNGNVGIGTIPGSRLEVYDGPFFSAHEANTFVIRSPQSSSPNDNRMLGMTITLDGSNDVHATYQKSVGIFAQSASDWSNNVDMLFYTRGTNESPYFTEKMRIRSNGAVGIGTTTTGTHKLAVEGTIGAREIKVEASGWSDFVFEKDYKLPTLEEVEKHITEEGHLPDVPSEEEVLENGIQLGEMNAKLLQKIEELTLYVIELNKQNKAQQMEIESLKSRLKEE